MLFQKTFEKPQCRKVEQMQPIRDFACLDPSSLRKHLKMHSVEKSNKCNQCDFASVRAGNLKTHLKTHSGKIQTNASNVTLSV